MNFREFVEGTSQQVVEPKAAPPHPWGPCAKWPASADFRRSYDLTILDISELAEILEGSPRAQQVLRSEIMDLLAPEITRSWVDDGQRGKIEALLWYWETALEMPDNEATVAAKALLYPE